ncbi:MAG TPA: ABC transporter ATP-binding protein [Gemmataceae bacterium]|jgi:putative ABC transport system ATP-binding protein|nr:ABC transporter ATP-binding protein [Gemmataceae bacterium]
MLSEKPALEARGLLRTFGSGETLATAVQDVSLSIYPGEMSLLMGPSGSGKSTLLALLSGLLRPDAGEVHCLGKDLGPMSEKELQEFRLRNFGYIFQGYNLFPALNALQQLEIVLRWGEGLSGREARKRSEAMLSTLGLSKKLHLRPAQMSGGEKQRVAIGRALVKAPMFCFADEPTSALDWAHGEQVIELLRSAARDRGTAVLVVAHDSRIVPMVDRVFHMEDGCMLEPEQAHDHQLWSVP